MKLLRYAAALLLLLAFQAQAAEGDSCSNASGQPGTEASGVCVAIATPDYGISCGPDSYYNGTSCVVAPANYESCSDAGHDGYYFNGNACVSYPESTYGACQNGDGTASSTHYFSGNACVANGTSCANGDHKWNNGYCAAPTPAEPSIPTPSGSLGGAASSLGPVVAPGAQGGQQPICVNSSPIIGAGMFVIAGSTLCYGTAADKSGTGIYAYHTNPSISVGGDPTGVLNSNTWNGLRLQDLFAEGNITALGQLRVYGGAQIYSPNGNSGLVVVNGQVLSGSSDGSNNAQHSITPNQVLTSVSNGSKAGALEVTADKIASGVTDGSATTGLELLANKATLTSQSGSDTGSFILTPEQASTSLSKGSASTLIDASATQIVNRVQNSSGGAYTQTTASAGSYQLNASNGTTGSRINVDGSSISLIAGQGGTTASNGTSGTTSGTGSGAIKVYESAQTIASGTTIGNLLDGKTYQSQVNGNLFVDGNVYINGTLEYVSSNAATTTVTSAATGSSILAGANMGTSGGTAIVMKDTDATHATIDRNGKISMTPGVSQQSSSALTLTNGLGNTHGFVVNETQATMSGGIHSSSLTLNDNGATFSNSATGMPVQVHGVADGTADYDAVNVRQLRQTREQLSAGIAGISAMANIPNVDTGKRFSMGAGMGHYQNMTSLAVSSSFRVTPNTVIRASVAGTDGGSSRTTTYGLGVGVSW